METKEFMEKPVNGLFFRYLIPSIMGTMVTSIYVLADTIMIGKGLGSVAMAALNIALPIYNIFFGLGLLFGVGGSVLMSIYRGRGERKGRRIFYGSFSHEPGSMAYSADFLCPVYGRSCLDFRRNRGDHALYHGVYSIYHLGYGSLFFLIFSTDICTK